MATKKTSFPNFLPIEELTKLRPKTSKVQASMDVLKISVPKATADWYRARAAKEGIAIQAVTAPVLNAYARGDIKQEFVEQVAAPA